MFHILEAGCTQPIVLVARRSDSLKWIKNKSGKIRFFPGSRTTRTEYRDRERTGEARSLRVYFSIRAAIGHDKLCAVCFVTTLSWEM